MERIDTSYTVRCELINTVCYPACSIACNNLYGGFLLICKLLVELSQDILPVPLSSPYDRICIVINDNSDVFVTFAVACLIDPLYGQAHQDALRNPVQDP